ncbi:MAG: response regulator [Fibrobacter sp.]|nr:response regulator [Fibrobacter sp.]
MKSDQKKVLVVDDEVSICEILAQFLNKKGYEVFTAASGEEALDILSASPVDLVVTDIKMPGISGVDLLKYIKENQQSVPVLITTGFPTLDTAIEALKLGAYDYLTKPFHLEEIGEKVKRAMINKQLEEENLLFSKLVSLHEVTKILASTLEISELNTKFLDYSIRMAKADCGALLFSDASNKLVISEAAGQYHEKSYWMGQPFVAASKWVARQQEPLVLESGMESLPVGLIPIPSDLQSFISFPLKTPSRNIGVLNLARVAGRDPFSNLDLEIINVLASQASISIENVRLYQNIRDNYLKTIRAFALAVEAKDEYTHGHSENVMKYTVVLAKTLGLAEAELELVKYAGLLHDIGKIGISESILNKAGRLTPEEFEEIKKHPELGVRIISDVPFLKALVPLVLHHHEYYCGGGYPTGIAGEQIPFGARILSVSDAYEAMTSDRPYRKSLPQEVAFSILEKEKGRQFDPRIVDSFLEIMRPNGK